MDIAKFFEPSLQRITDYVNSNTGPYRLEQITSCFYGTNQEVDMAPNIKRKLDLESPKMSNKETTKEPPKETPNEKKKQEVSKDVPKESSKVQKEAKKEPLKDSPKLQEEAKKDAPMSKVQEETKKEPLKETEKESFSTSSKEKEITTVERSSAENMLPPDEKVVETKSIQPKVKWFDKKRQYVIDVDTNNILKFSNTNNEYILVGRVDVKDTSKKTLIDVGQEALLYYNGSINKYEYDQNYFINDVKKPSKTPSV